MIKPYRRIKVVRQPDDKPWCGQTCVAMLLGIKDVKTVCTMMGKKGETKAKEIGPFLREHGYECGDRLVRVSKKRPLPEKAMVKMKYDGTHKWHWVLKWGILIHDPARGTMSVKGAGKYGRLTSFLEVTERENPTVAR